jgi:hypothetical protein
MGRFCVALLHHPVLHKDGSVISSAITNTDVHDIARTCTTYAVDAFYLVTPVDAQLNLADRLIHHWQKGAGADRNKDRNTAFRIVHTARALEDVLARERTLTTGPVEAWATSAQLIPGAVPISQGRRLLEEHPGTVVMLLGTAHGLAPAALAACQRALLPIPGRTHADGTHYNHLSVRAAAALLVHALRADQPL